VPYLVLEWAVASLQLHNATPNITLIQRDILTLALYPLCYFGLSAIIRKIQSI
jgi:hypothetical protein